jgi:hypothetical protein
VIDRIQYWNVTPQERVADHPADDQRPGGSHLVRAIDVDADPAVVFRWLCQVTVAPYSFDLVDNLGRRSPSTLTPGADELRIGEKFGIGPIVDFETGRHIAAVSAGAARRMFGDLAMSYQVVPGLRTRSRILACIAIPAACGRASRAWQALLGAGDLVMIRHQLHRLRRYAEASDRP